MKINKHPSYKTWQKHTHTSEKSDFLSMKHGERRLKKTHAHKNNTEIRTKELLTVTVGNSGHTM